MINDEKIGDLMVDLLELVLEIPVAISANNEQGTHEATNKYSEEWYETNHILITHLHKVLSVASEIENRLIVGDSDA